MTTLLRVCATLATVTGCSSFDEDVFPEDIEAYITVAPAAPAELARIVVTLELAAGPRANHDVVLDRVSLSRPGDGVIDMNLEMAFAGRTTYELDPNDEVNVALVNVGTTNADLADLCGERYHVYVGVAYADEPGTSTGDASAAVPITCP